MLNSTKQLRRWYWVHEWSSLISTLFILVACVTGLPLVFHDELEELFSSSNEPEPNGESVLDFDALIAAAEAAEPGSVTQFVSREPTDPGITVFGVGEAIDAPLEDGTILRISNADGRVLDAGGGYDGVLGAIAQLHIELFAGQLGTLFLGLMTLFLLVALVSGVVLYSPYMGNRGFAAVRKGSSRRSVVRPA